MAEDLLRKYRPSGPAAALRARIVVPERAAWPWAVAAAALLALTVGLRLQTGALAADALAQSPDPLSFEMRVAALTEMLGEGEDARRTAVLLVAKEELQRRLPQSPMIPEGER